MSKDSTSDFERLVQKIKAREYTPVYLLQGEEPYYIDQLTHILEQTVLKPEEKSFNLTTFYGKDTTVRDIIMAAKRYPMMSTYQLIIVKEAQNLRKDQLDLFIPYLENPLKSTILVLNFKAKKIDQRTKVAKTFKNHTIFNSDRLYDNQIPSWVDRHIRTLGKHIEPQASQMIADFLGNNLQTISNEIGKMMVQVPEHVQIISTKHVEESIGINREFNVFELQKAIGENKFGKAIQIVTFLGENDASKGNFIAVISSLTHFFQKLLLYHQSKNSSPKEISTLLGVHEFFIKEYRAASQHFDIKKIEKAIGLLRYFDLKSKGVGATKADSSELMRELVFKILQ
jgi:DNA polymerase III subunit delta